MLVAGQVYLNDLYVLTVLCLLLSMLLCSTLLLWCTLQNGWLWLFSLKVYIC